MKFSSIKYFFRKCDQIRRKLGIWSHLLKKSLTENFIFCAVPYEHVTIVMTNAGVSKLGKVKLLNERFENTFATVKVKADV